MPAGGSEAPISRHLAEKIVHLRRMHEDFRSIETAFHPSVRWHATCVRRTTGRGREAGRDQGAGDVEMKNAASRIEMRHEDGAGNAIDFRDIESFFIRFDSVDPPSPSFLKSEMSKEDGMGVIINCDMGEG